MKIENENRRVHGKINGLGKFSDETSSNGNCGEVTSFGGYNSQLSHVQHYRSRVESERQQLHVVCGVWSNDRKAEVHCDGKFEC